MIDLEPFESLVPLEHGLSVVVTRRADTTPHATVVNAGVMAHPLTGDQVVAFVARGSSLKVRHLRADPTVVVSIRVGWRWASVEGIAGLIGPDDPTEDVDGDRLRLLLREVFQAAGGTHDDWDTYDRVMRDERRTAVFVAPSRVLTNSA